jgi:hypothetical protein
MGAAAAGGALDHCLVARAVALVALVAALPLMLGAMALHHLAFHLAIHFLAAFVLALVLGMLPLLMLGVLRGGVLRMVDGSSRGRLCRCDRNGCEKDVHRFTP